MPSIGKTAKLQITKEVDFGVYLDGDDLGEILLPKRYVPEGALLDDWIEVFIYLDSEDIIIATTEKPLAEVGQCAHLKVVDKNSIGAFMNWGLPKDLFVPFREQKIPMERGRSYTVFIFEDNTGRICGSSKLDHFLNEHGEESFTANQPVDLLICGQSPLGYKAVINNTHLGLIHKNDILAGINIGDRVAGYIKNVRFDGAIDLTLQSLAKDSDDQLMKKILADLEQSGGVLHLTDKSPPEDIFKTYQVSKAHYKKILGKLYKNKKILLQKDKITLLK
jgi:predicted RNA-binding protein (virulence factor B family)